MVPVDVYYATLVNRRQSNLVRSFYRDDCFNYSTRMEFKELMNTHFKVERSAENIRRSLKRNPYFNIYDAFTACDLNEDGIVTENEIRSLLE